VYLKEENRALRGRLGTRVRLTDAERRRLARLGKALGRKTLQEVASIASPRRSTGRSLRRIQQSRPHSRRLPGE